MARDWLLDAAGGDIERLRLTLRGSGRSARRQRRSERERTARKEKDEPAREKAGEQGLRGREEGILAAVF